MNRTSQNEKKTNFGQDFDLFNPNLGLQNFFRGFCLYYMLNIVETYHRIQFQGKTIIQFQENGKITSFWA